MLNSISQIKIDKKNIKDIIYIILMIYIVCPTCGFFIGSNAIEYDKKKAEICANSDLTDDQQADEIQKLLKSLKIRRYCCRMRIMTTKDIVQDIIAAEN